MKIKTMLLMVAAILLTLPASAAAQDCWECDDSDWTDPQCVEAGWAGFGGTQCIEGVTECWVGGDYCVGPPNLAATQLLPEGTILAFASQDGGELVRVDSDLRLARNCQDLVVRRVYSARASAAIRISSAVLDL